MSHTNDRGSTFALNRSDPRESEIDDALGLDAEPGDVNTRWDRNRRGTGDRVGLPSSATQRADRHVLLVRSVGWQQRPLLGRERAHRPPGSAARVFA